MDPNTGKIREFESEEKAKEEGYTVLLKREPKPNCKKCYGRGHVGKNDKGEYVPCSCAM